MPVSVVIAAYNAQDTIERAISSALNQTYPPYEVIVADDVSTDETRAIVREMAKSEPRIRLVENTVNKGPAGSRNAAIRVARGEWIAILDADDAWAPERLKVMIDAAVENDADIVADNQFLYDAGAGEVTRVGFASDHGTRWILPADVFEQEIKLGSEFSYGILKPVIRKIFLDKSGILYDEDIRFGEDTVFLAEILLTGARAILIPSPLYIYTTRFGDRSGEANPNSKSIHRFDLLAESILNLKVKYNLAISGEIDRAMTRIADRFYLEHEANLARDVRRRKGLLAYAFYVSQRPSVLAEVLGRRTAGLLRHLSVA